MNPICHSEARRFVGALCAAAVVLLVVSAQATDFTWNATNTQPGFWSTVSNWTNNSGTPTTASDNATFTGSTNQQAQFSATTLTVGGMVFNNSGTTLIGGNGSGSVNVNITLGQYGIKNSGSGVVTFGVINPTGGRVAMTLGASQTWLNDGTLTFASTNGGAVTLGANMLTIDGSGTTSIAGVIGSTTAGNGITKNGTGTLAMTGTNTFDGGIIMNTGILSLGSNAAIGTGVLTINGGTIDVTAARTTTNNNAQNWNGNFTFTGTFNWDTGTGAVTMNASRTVTVSAGDLGVGGAIGDSGSGFSLTKTGAGTLTLSGANTYTGATTVSSGTLMFAQQVALYNNSTASWTSGNFVVESGATAAFDVGGAGEFTSSDIDILKALGTGSGGFKNGSNLGLDTTDVNFSYASNISNPNGGSNALGLTKLGTGILTLSGTNSYTGGTSVTAGVLSFANTAAQPSSGTVTVGAGATLALGVGGGGFFSAANVDSLWANTLTNVSMDAASLVGVDTTAGNFTYNTAQSTRGLVKIGANTLTLGGANTYTGGTTINAGTLKSGASNVLADTGAVNVNANTASTTAILNLNNFNDTIGTLTIGGVGGTASSINQISTGTGTLTLGGNVNTDATGNFTTAPSISGKLALGAASRTFTVADSTGSASDLDISAVISGASNRNLTKAGTGTMTLSGLNTYAGRTLISAGSLSINTIADAGSNSSIGAPAAAQAVIALGATTVSGTLIYTGSGHSSNRKFDLAGTTGGATIQADGSGALVFGNATNTASGAGNKTLTLQGSSTQANEITGTIVDNAAVTGVTSLAKDGAGTWVLSGANTYTGGTTLIAGTLNINNAGSGGTSSAIGAGALTISGGTIDNTSAGAITLSTNNAVTLAADFSYGGTQDLNLGTGAVTLTQANTPGRTITLSGTGRTLTFGGVVTGSSATAPIVTVNGAGNTLVLGSLVLNLNTTVRNNTWGGSANVTVNGGISGGGNANHRLTYNGSGTFTIAGASTYNGTTTLTAGTLKAADVQAFGTSVAANALALNGGTLDLATNTSVNAYNATVGGSVTIASDRATSGAGITHTLGTLSIGANTLSITAGANATGTTAGVTFGSVTQTGASVFNVASGTTLTLGALQTTAQNITKQNSGTMILGTAANTARVAGTNTLTDGTLVLGGTVGTTDALGTAATTLVLNGGTLALATDASVLAHNTTVGGCMTIASDRATSGAGITHTLGTLSIGAQTMTVNSGTNVSSGTAGLSFGATTMTGASIFTVNDGSVNTLLTLASLANGGNLATFNGSLGDTTVTGVISGAGGLTMSGTGVLTLNGANTYTGDTLVSSGTLALNSTGALGNSILDTSSAAGSLTTNQTTLTIGGLKSGTDLASLFASGYSGVTDLTFNSTATNTYSGVIANGASGMTLTKNGSGTQTLAGTNTYTGLTTINAGTLKLGVSNAINSGNNLTVGSAGIFDLAGNDQTLGLLTNGGNVTNSGALKTLTIGNGSTGAGNFTGTVDLVWNQGATSSAITGSTLGMTGNLTLNANGAGTIGFTTANHTGTVANSGSSTGTTTITTIGTNVTGVYQNSTTSTLTLNGANTFTSGLVLNAGVLSLGNDAALGGVGNVLTINGGTVDVTAARTTTNNNAQNWNGDFTFNGTNTWNTGSGAVTMNASRTVTVNASTMTVGGAIGESSSGFGLTKNGTGALTLNPTIAKAVTTTANSTVVTMADTTGVTIGQLISGTGITGGTTVIAIGAGNVTISANATASGSVTANVGVDNTYTGGTTLNAGTLNLLQNGSLGAGALIINGGALGQTSSTGYRVTLSTNNAITINADFGANITNSNASLDLGTGNVNLGTTAGTSRTITVTGGMLLIGGNITNGTTANQLIKAGNGILDLSGNSTSQFTGGLVIKQGTVNLSNGAQTAGGNAVAAGNATITLGDAAGGDARLSTGSFTVTNNIQLGTGATGNLTIGSTGATRSAIFSGDIDMNGNNLTLLNAGTSTNHKFLGNFTGAGNLLITNTVNATAGVVTMNGTINNTGNITFNNTPANSSTVVNGNIGSNVVNVSTASNAGGTVTLNGTNTYTGNTTIGNTGILKVNSAAALGNGTKVTINQNGTLINTANMTLSKDVIAVGASNGINPTANTTLKITGKVDTSTSGTGQFIIASTGAVELTNSANTFRANTNLLIQNAGLFLGHANALNGALLKYNGGNGRLDNTSGSAMTVTSLTGFSLTTGFTFVGTDDLDLSAIQTGFTQTVTAKTITVSAKTLTMNGIQSTGTDASGAAYFDAPLIKAGNGTLVLTGASSYTLGTTVTAGTLKLGNAASLGTGSLTINGTGVTMDVTTNLTTANDVILNGGELTFGGTANWTISGNVSMDQQRTFTANGGNLTIGGVLSSNVTDTQLSKAGAGTMILGSAIGANMTSTTNITGGTLRIAADGAIAQAALQVKDNLGGTAAFDLNGHNNSINNITLGSASSTAASVNNIIDSVGGGLITMGGSITYDATGNPLGSLISANLQAGNVTRSIVVGDSTNAANDLTISGVISSSGSGGGISKSDVGTLVLTGNNTYTGATFVTAGTISFNSGNTTATGIQALGANATVNLGVVASSSGVLNYTGAGDTLAKDINALGNGTDTIQNSGSGLLTLSGAITKNGTVLTLKGGSNGINVTGSIGGSSSGSDLIIDGGLTTLASANTYNGPTFIINGASLTANITDALPTANGRTAVSMDQTGSGSSTVLLGADQTIASLTGATTSAVNLNSYGLTVGTTSGSTVFSGVISGTGSVTKDDASTQILNGNNTYNGTTTISAGTLQIGNGTDAGSIGATSAITNNGSLVYNVGNGTRTLGATIGGTGSLTQNSTGGLLTLTGNNTYNGTTTISAGTLQIGNGTDAGSIGATSAITNNGSLVYNVGNGTRTLGAPIGGTGSLTQNSTGGLLTLTGNNTYTGNTTINGGAISIAADSGLGTAPGSPTANFLNLNDGALYTTANLTLDSNRGITLGGTLGGQMNVTGGTTLTYGGVIAGSKALEKAGSGVLVLSGNNTYSGATLVSAGTLQVGDGGTSGTFGGDAVTNNGTLVFNRSDTLTASNDIAGTGVLTQNGSGTTILTGNLSYSGDTTVNAGTLQFANASGGNLTTGNVTVNGGAFQLAASDQLADSSHVTINAGGTFELVGGNITQTISGFTNDGGTFTTGSGENNLLVGVGNTINWNNGINTITTNNTVSDKSWNIRGGTNTVQQGGTMQISSGGSGLQFRGTGTPSVTLNSSNSTAGRIVLQGNVTVESTLSGTSSILNGGNGTNSGFVDMAGGNRTFTVGNGTASTDFLVTAILSNGTVTKDGTGTMAISGNNTYTGSTNVNEGTLLVNGNQTAATGNVTVASGATLGGNGTLGGATTISGILAPGNNDIGTLNIANNVTWVGAATAGANTDWIFDLGASNASDLLNITGDFLNDTSLGTNFRFDFNGSAHSGTFVLVNWSGSTGFSASDFSFTNLGGGLTGSFAFNGSQLEFSAVPEPSTWVGMAVLAMTAGMMFLRRRPALQRVVSSRRAARRAGDE